MTDQNYLPTDPVEKPDDFQAMLIGGGLVFILSIIPFVNFLGCCLIIQILGSLLAIHVYTNKYKLTLSPGKGIMLGILTCLLGGIAAFVLTMILQKLGLDFSQQFMQEQMIKMAENFGGPEAAEQVREEIERQNIEGVGVVQIVIGLVISVIFNSVGGLIGGAIGAAVFKRAPEAVPPAPAE